MNSLEYGEISGDTFGIYYMNESFTILPSQRKYSQTVPGKSGYIDFGIGGYETLTIKMDLYCFNTYDATLVGNVAAWLSNINGQPKKLALSKDPTKYYMAKVYTGLEFGGGTKLGTVEFECNPPYAFIDGVLQTPEEITWQTAVKDGNQYMQAFTAPGHMRFTNIGTLLATPKIKLLNNIPAGLKLTYNGDSWQYDASLVNDGIIIDSASQTVTRASDGHNLYQNVNPTKDAYFYFAPGQVNIDVTATGLGAWPNNLIIIVEFTPQGVG